MLGNFSTTGMVKEAARFTEGNLVIWCMIGCSRRREVDVGTYTHTPLQTINASEHVPGRETCVRDRYEANSTSCRPAKPCCSRPTGGIDNV